MLPNLLQLILDRIERDGVDAAAKHYGVTAAAVKNWRAGSQIPTTLSVLQQAINDELTKNPPLDLSIAPGKKAVVLIPIHRHIEGKTHVALTKAYAAFGRDQLDEIPQFGTDVERARCILADRALKTGAEQFIFCDGDAVPPFGFGVGLRNLGYDIPEPNASFNAFERILSMPAEMRIVSALCYLRRLPLVAACSTGIAGGYSAAELVRLRGEPGETGIGEQEWVGMHFCRIHRSVFEDMRKEAAENFPEIIPTSSDAPWGYFLKENAAQSEDGAFCLRARKIGIKSYMDTALRVGHVMDSVI